MQRFKCQCKYKTKLCSRPLHQEQLKMRITAASLSFILALAAIASAQTDCPNTVPCADNPCDTERCLRFLNADCVPNPCHGSCTANFFRAGSSRNVTDRCAAVTCNERQCPPKRVCIEDVVPAACPQGNARCRQRLNTRCIRPQNCSQLSCKQEEICILENESPRCVDPLSITRCVELDCSPFGRECQQFQSQFNPEREDIFFCAFPAKCTPARVEFCSQRPGNLGCDEFNNLADCVSTCNSLQCERRGRECALEGPNGRAICRTPTTCTPDRIRICEQIGRVCEENNGTTNCVEPSTTPPPTVCSANPCSADQLCVDFLEDGAAVTFLCVTPNCRNGRPCGPGFQCIVERMLGFIGASGLCVPNEVHYDLETDCRNRLDCLGAESQGASGSGEPFNCNVVDFQGITVGTVCYYSQLPQAPTTTVAMATSCDQLECLPGLNCLEIPTVKATRAVCLEDYASNCEDLACAEGSECALPEFPSRNFSLAMCGTDIQFPPPTETCASNPCQTDQLCVNINQQGTVALFLCISQDCNNGVPCEQGLECIVEPQLGPIGASGVCVPEQFRFDVETDCSNRLDCEEQDTSSICNTVDFQGIIVGTLCTGKFPVLAPTCDELNCAKGGECTETTVNDRSVATCVESEAVDQFLEDLVHS